MNESFRRSSLSRSRVDVSFVVIALAVLSAAVLKTTAHAQPTVFRETEGRVVSPALDDGAVLRARAVSVDARWLASPEGGRTLTLNMFPDVSFVGTVTQSIRRPSGPMLTGEILNTNPPGAFVLLVDGNRVTGRVIAPQKGTYVIRTLDDRTTVIQEIDTSKFEPCGADEMQALAPAPAGGAQGVAAGRYCEDESIDLLMVYTPMARDAAIALGTDINSLIQESVALANLALANSQLQHRINIVHTQEVDYDESGTNHLSVLTSITDETLAEVRPLRDQYKADVVGLAVSSSNYCGTAYQTVNLWTPEIDVRAYHVVKVSCMASTLVFAHEIGHNLGCAHDRESCNITKILDPYSYGYRFAGAGGTTFRTVMAYPPGQRIPYFSNPDILFDGARTGAPVSEPLSAHNAQTISTTWPILSKLRCVGPTDCNDNGVPDDEDIDTGTSVDANGNRVPDDCEVALRVKASAPAGGDCLSWATACNDLRTALDIAALPWTGVTEIWVATGTYKPDRGTGDRTEAFPLLNDVGVFGGFAGDETSRSQRAGLFDRTILSGDLAGDDGPGFANRTDNSYRVVSVWGLDQTAVLDGFKVYGGYADGEPPYNNSGGIRAYNSSARFSNLIISSNFGLRGGGMGVAAVIPSAPEISNCTFRGNRSAGGGGGFVSNANTEPILFGCKFFDNVADNGGGAFTNGGHLRIADSVFAGNEARYGGAISAGKSFGDVNVTVVNSVFTGNRATSLTGGINLEAVEGRIENCSFYGNLLGGLAFRRSTGYAVNSVFHGNSQYGATWSTLPVDVHHCCLQASDLAKFPDASNMSADPLFVDADGRDDLVGTEDDDLRLTSNSPALDAGDNASVSMVWDLAGVARIMDSDGDEESDGVLATVDMGAYELALGKVCGGIRGIPCAILGEFCSLPLGACCCDFMGQCTARPDSCVAVSNPVCGCDGGTYGSECEAAMAGVSIEHRGECESRCGRPGDPSCPPGSFCKFPAGACYTPAGGVCTQLGANCPDVPEPVCGCDGLTYPSACHATYLEGVSIYYDGQCFQHLPLDDRQPSCTACPVADCSGCAAGACHDARITLCEVIAYACAWMHGCNDQMADLTRGGFVWRNGECYCWEEADQNWYPSECGAEQVLACGDYGQGASAAAASNGGHLAAGGTATLRTGSPVRGAQSGDCEVTIELVPKSGTSAVAAELIVPKGWNVVAVDDGGRFDTTHRKIKWGPYFDDSSRTVVARFRSGGGCSGKTGRISASRAVSQPVQGTASFDGVNREITVEK